MSSTRTLRVRPAKAHPSFGSRARTPPKTNRSTVQRPRARPQPIAPLPLPPATVPAAQLLARLFPDADDEARQASLEDTIRSEGSREAGLALLQRAYNMFNTCPVEGAPLPPAGVALKSINIGLHTIFYHTTYPPEMQADRTFTWSFYIGRAGQGRGSIITDWSQQNIVFRIQIGWGTWEKFSTLLVLPRTTIRVSYPDSSGGIAQEELIFPADPRETPVASHQLA
ncbi:hypothetical protein B0H14DRAFT_2867633 [Mycena olivaceomarginata]|nr:hypothetical protein B0H14DRAFT_2867633 [Mycena olivaceomarginata]